MYLSRLILNPHSRRVQREVADPYQMHRSLMRAFPDGLRQGEERILFRLEADPRSGALTLLVQSHLPPDWSWLATPGAAAYLLPAATPNPAVKSFDLHLAAGQVLAFRLRANPTARRRLPDGSQKRVGLCHEDEQIAWLHRKAAQSGFAVLSARTGGQTTAAGHLERDGKKHDLSLLSVQFDGLLQVTNPERLYDAVAQGIGSGKGLGFGLLSLARPHG